MRSRTCSEANLDFYIIFTVASQGWETQNLEDTKSPKHDDTKSSQKKTWFEHG
jgi:hypothetical protein